MPASGSFGDAEELQSLKGDRPRLGLKSSQEERKAVMTVCKVASYWVSSGPPGPNGPPVTVSEYLGPLPPP